MKANATLNTLCQTRAKQAKVRATVTSPSNTNPY